MTKLRSPMSIENTLRVVLGQLEIERAAEVTGRRTAYLSQCSDEAKPQLLSVRDLETLDLEHHARFGTGFPLYEALGRRMETARADRFVDEIAIARAAIDHTREAGQASAAMIAASIPSNNSHAVLTEALRELDESAAATTTAIATITAALRRTQEGAA